MAAPSIPSRPSRSPNVDIPRIPPRPKRNIERSISPNRDTYARSPFNDPSFVPTKGAAQLSSSLSRSISRDLPPRPPSVTFPSVGEEGQEYGALTPDLDKTHNAAEPKTAVAGDLPLHAPKASLPVSTAKSRIAAVTRTDSDSAAAVGIGKPSSEHEGSHLARTVSRASSSHSRPSSIFRGNLGDEDEEQGIPEIGMQIPLYPNAGDVQAPTPVAASLPPSTGVGFFNKGDQPEKRHHFRTKSGREFYGPPGSYGMHGHGLINHKDPFEKAWYDKHPDERKKESQGEYGPHNPEPKKPYNLTSVELNKLVHEPHHEDRSIVGTPDEQVGYLASDEYTSRMVSPRPASAAKRSSQSYAESPLRKMGFPTTEGANLTAGKASSTVMTDDDDDEIIHVHPPASAPPSEHKPPSIYEQSGTPDAYEEAPILAADEVAYRPEAQYLTPAVDPDRERRGSGFFGGDITPTSRPHSRSNSVQHQVPITLTRFASASERELSSTPLEDVKEYEPLFPEDEGPAKAKKPRSIRREDLTDDENQPRHHFPSKDIWEDVPDSMLYETTVKTPQLPETSRREAEHEPKELFEGPEEEGKRKADLPIAEPDFLKQYQKSRFNKDVASDMSRPGLKQRFPSQDIWEDTPDSLLHTATIEPDAKVDALAAKSPQVPARPSRGAGGQEQSSPVDRRAPTIPDRPKPQVPSRPARKASSSDETPLARSTSREDEAGAPKAKPPVPSKPGGKIAALKAGFLNDLNSKLQVGPQAPPKAQEPEAEKEEEQKAPLADARKGRARGPARRRPGAASGSGESKPFKLSFATAVTIWEIDEEGELSFSGEKRLEPEPADEAEPAAEAEAVKAEESSEAAVAVSEEVRPKLKSQRSDSSTQTGQLDIEVPKAPGEHGDREKVTIYIDGRADKKGTVVVKDGVEHVGEQDGLGGIEKTTPVNPY